MLHLSNSSRTMEARDHFKNGARLKSHTSRGNFLRMVCFALLAGVFILSGCKKDDGDEDKHESVRYDGMYIFDDTQFKYYLRFYDDGTVRTGSTSGTVVISEENDDYHSIGEYEIVENQISFQATSVAGSVDYDGHIYKDKLILNSYSHINGNERENAEWIFNAW